MIIDIWKSSYKTWTLAAYFFSILLGSILGPVANGYVAEHRGIKLTQNIVLIASAACLVLVVCMQETSKKAILRHKNGPSRKSPL